MSGTARFTKKIAELVMESELQNVNNRKELRFVSANLRTLLGVLLFNDAIEKRNTATKSRLTAITCPQEKISLRKHFIIQLRVQMYKQGDSPN